MFSFDDTLGFNWQLVVVVIIGNYTKLLAKSLELEWANFILYTLYYYLISLRRSVYLCCFTWMQAQLKRFWNTFAYSVTCGIFHKLSLCYIFTVTCKVHVLYNLMPAHMPTSCRILCSGLRTKVISTWVGHLDICNWRRPLQLKRLTCIEIVATCKLIHITLVLC